MHLQTTLIGGDRVVASGNPDVPPLMTPTDNIVALTALQVGGPDNVVVYDAPVLIADSLTRQEPHPDGYIHSPDPVFSTTVIESGTGPKFNRGLN